MVIGILCSTVPAISWCALYIKYVVIPLLLYAATSPSTMLPTKDSYKCAMCNEHLELLNQ